MSLLRATIHVDGLAYQGEDPDATYPAPGPGNGGWHTYIGEAVNVLKFTDGEPHLIESITNLRSHLERIMRRVQDGHITASRITIDIQQD